MGNLLPTRNEQNNFRQHKNCKLNTWATSCPPYGFDFSFRQPENLKNGTKTSKNAVRFDKSKSFRQPERL
ncbi:MAG: hypothetical protein J5680_02105 [Neisseriaceae bacterium]|nr:hypothetical protein [Neisseriaceae bacterium]